MRELDFNRYNFRFQKKEDSIYIFDEIRRRFMLNTPEEWVRQNVVKFLNVEKGFPKSHINVERLLKVNGIAKRYDVVVFEKTGKINLLVECKAPEVEISQNTFDQIARYNLALDAKYLMVTNGLKHYFCQMDNVEKRYVFLREIPDYKKLEVK